MFSRQNILRLAFLLSLAIFPWLVMGPLGKYIPNLPVRFGVYVVLVFAGSLLMKKGWNSLSGFIAVSLTTLAYAVSYKIACFIPDVSAYPFSLGWSEVSRYYYASLFFSEKLYGVDLPLSVLHPTRYLMQSLPFLFSGSSLWLHRLWQVWLWISMTGLTSWLVWWRIKRSQATRLMEQGASHSHSNERLTSSFLGIGVILFAFLFLFQGPVYYHLLVMAIVVLWGYDSKHFLRTLGLVLLASLWAGVSRINWLPVPGMLAASLYFLEKPVSGDTTETRIGLRASWTLLVHYLVPPAVWVLLGTSAGYLMQEAYTTLSGNPKEVFGSSFSSDLLWYRLLPNPTYPLGILLSATLVSLPLLLLAGLHWRRNRGYYHPVRILGLAGILLVLFAGGVVVSVKIGGGSNLHNLDAYLMLLLVIGVFSTMDLFTPDKIRQNERTQKPVQNRPLEWMLLAAAILIPCAFSLSSGGLFPQRDIDTAQSLLEEIRAEVASATANGGEVLFISQRHLLTFNQLGASSVALIPDYEQVFLMEMAMGRNQSYLEQFQSELQAQRYTLIISDPLTTNLQGQAHSFGEENDAWVRKVAKPILCYYEPVLKAKEPSVMLLAPRQSPCK